MTITLNIAPAIKLALQKEAAKHGQDAATYAQTLLEERLRAACESDPAYLLTLPIEERDRILEAQAEKAAPFYEADLALPVAERELTAFTALNDDPVLEGYLRAPEHQPAQPVRRGAGMLK